MRICHVSPHLPPDQAANALLPADLGDWTRGSGGEVSFVAHEPSQGGSSSGLLAGPVFRVPRRARRGLRRLLRIDALQITREIGRALDRTAATADLLHLHSNGLIIETAAGWARRRGRPYALTLYGTEIWHYRRRWPIDRFTRAYRGAGVVTFYSRSLLERACVLGLERGDMHVIYPAVRETFRPRDDAARIALRRQLGIAEPRLALNVKRLHELADQTTLIAAFARLARDRNDMRLVICGTGPLGDELRGQAVQLGVAGRVTFTGLVSNALVAQYAAAADVFVLPSLLEAMPTVAVEALASGTPVVSADHPGGVELHGLFGNDVRLVPRRDVDALAAALEEALWRPRRVHAATFAVLRNRFSPAAVHQAYSEVYAGLTSVRA